MVLNYLRISTYFLFSISTLLSSFICANEKCKDSIPAPDNNVSKLKSAITTIELLFSLALFAVGVILVNFKYTNLAWISIIIATPLYLFYILGAHMSIGIIGNVIHSKNTGKLSADENSAIRTVAYTLFLLDISCKVPARLLDFAKNIANAPISDLVYISFYVLFLFLYLFLTCALLTIPLSALTKLMIKLNAFFNSKFKILNAGDFFIERVKNQKVTKPLLLKAINATKNKCIIFSAFVWIFSPIFLTVGVLFKLANVLLHLVCIFIWLIFSLVKSVKHTIGNITIWIRSLSEYQAVATSFRISIIAALTIAVFHNRYAPLFKEYESSTGFFEFIASAILIPVVLEWISSKTPKQQK